jgi:hypothetical protein
MTKRVEVKTDLTVEMLYERYRKAKDPVERTQWQVKEGKSPQEVAELFGYTLGGFAGLSVAGMHQEKQGSPTIVENCQEPNHCSQQSSKASWPRL